MTGRPFGLYRVAGWPLLLVLLVLLGYAAQPVAGGSTGMRAIALKAPLGLQSADRSTATRLRSAVSRPGRWLAGITVHAAVSSAPGASPAPGSRTFRADVPAVVAPSVALRSPIAASEPLTSPATAHAGFPGYGEASRAPPTA